ncbi:hydrogenase formation protein HypD [Alteromonas mediterranea]|uniref:hydrogenase formation protein HypD n=1 Tax=Alteromonas mediterranea TaxID=314275 RepID=UPI002FDF5D49
MHNVESLLNSVKSETFPKPLRILNVCGGHERAITKAGLRTLFDHNVHLIPGPGCPVCICPEEDIACAITLAFKEKVILVSFGDMVRVPISDSINGCHSLADAKTKGANIRAIASPNEALFIALSNPKSMVIFFAVGFETTMAPIAAALQTRLPTNLKMLLSGRLTWPAVEHLLKKQSDAFDALVAPGHVATIMGVNQWRFIVEHFDLPVCVSGFHSESLILAIYTLIEDRKKGRHTLTNAYPEVVRGEGNVTAQSILKSAFNIVDANWRGIGVIPASGFVLSEKLADLDVFSEFKRDKLYNKCAEPLLDDDSPCTSVTLGQLRPDHCPYFGKSCKPNTPKGACMVSAEGACRIWYASADQKAFHTTSERIALTRDVP